MTRHTNVPVVALFVRIPVPGQVKTRLAADLGDENACRLYHAMVTDVLGAIRSSGLPMYLFYDGSDLSHLPKAWQNAACRVIAQQGEGLGERMAAAFQQCFAENNSSVILVGSDIPGLSAGMLGQAAQVLQTCDAVITPVVDGGYCLLALKSETYHPELFHDIPWSTDRVFRATRAAFRKNRLEACVLATLQDIDTLDDLRHFCHRRAEEASATWATINALKPFINHLNNEESLE
jgi:hypothetical protein